MIRLIYMSTTFIAITAALLWFGMTPAEEQDVDFNEVSRSEPDLLGIQPTLTPAMPTPRQIAAPAPQPALQPKPVQPAPQPTPQIVAAAPQPAQAAPAPAAKTPGETDAMEALRLMSYGIMKEFQAPAGKPAKTGAHVATLAIPMAEPATAAASVVEPTWDSYTVQPGDSLPGIAFRFYGTTVAYLQILEANEEILPDPSSLRAGMILAIPKDK